MLQHRLHTVFDPIQLARHARYCSAQDEIVSVVAVDVILIGEQQFVAGIEMGELSLENPSFLFHQRLNERGGTGVSGGT